MLFISLSVNGNREFSITFASENDFLEAQFSDIDIFW
jgi:hypothetical protein